MRTVSRLRKFPQTAYPRKNMFFSPSGYLFSRIERTDYLSLMRSHVKRSLAIPTEKAGRSGSSLNSMARHPMPLFPSAALALACFSVAYLKVFFGVFPPPHTFVRFLPDAGNETPLKLLWPLPPRSHRSSRCNWLMVYGAHHIHTVLKKHFSRRVPKKGRFPQGKFCE